MGRSVCGFTYTNGFAGCKDIGGIKDDEQEPENPKSKQDDGIQWDAAILSQLTQNINILKEYNHA